MAREADVFSSFVQAVATDRVEKMKLCWIVPDYASSRRCGHQDALCFKNLLHCFELSSEFLLGKMTSFVRVTVEDHGFHSHRIESREYL